MSYNKGIEVATVNKDNDAVGLDLMFNGLKSWAGVASGSASENTRMGIEVMLDQAKKTISDAKVP